ncbi:MAG: ABC transporter permease [Acidobacteria bacterium]|nr:ABC transporter permease [Acidobacteriota bacterium]
MQTLWQDLRYGARMLMKKPGFSLIAVITLALGIGANTAIFSVVNGVLLKPLPYRAPEQLIRVFERSRSQPKFPMSGGNFQDYRGQNSTLSGLALFTRQDLELSQDDRPERLAALRVSAGFFELLGTQPLLGREFRREDELPDNNQVVILSHGLWQRRFNSNPGVVGDVKDFPHSPAAAPAFYWATMQQPLFGARQFTIAVRANADPLSLVESVRGEIRSLDKDLPLADAQTLETIAATAVAGRRLTLWLVGFFALTAMALAAIGIYSVLSYLVSQRAHEIGLRMALGAQLGDVLKLVIRQGMTLVLLGLALGLGAAFALTRLIKGLLFEVSATDPLAFALAASLLALVSLLACYIPARRATKVDPMVALRCE